MLDEQPLAALAERVDIGERQLRRLFVERLGVAPIGVHGTRRLLFAKQLLTETAMPITEVALAAGFGSLRRFNAAFLEAYRMAPRDLRKQRARSARRNADAAAGLSAAVRLRRDAGFPARTRVAGRGGRRCNELLARDRPASKPPGWLRVSQWPRACAGRSGEHALKLELHGAPPTRMLEIVNRLAAHVRPGCRSAAIADALSVDTRLRPLLKQRPGLRLPSGWDGFEIAVRAIIGQQISVAGARTLAARLSQRFGQPLPTPFAPGLDHLFPTPEALADADLAAIGLTRARAETVRTVARALLDGRVDFRPERTLDDFTARWVALPGIGPWTAHYIATARARPSRCVPRRRPGAAARGAERWLAHERQGIDAQRSEAWRPWRAYAVIHLWKDSMPRAEAAKERSRVK